MTFPSFVSTKLTTWLLFLHPDLTLDRRLGWTLIPRLCFSGLVQHTDTHPELQSADVHVWVRGRKPEKSHTSNCLQNFPSPPDTFGILAHICSCFSLTLICDVFLNTAPLFAKFKLAGPIPQETPFDPRWNSSFDGGGDGLRGLLHGSHQGRQALQSAGPWASLPAGDWTQREDLTHVVLNIYGLGP